MARATRGNQAQFTYDFGIAIAQSTVSRLVRLTGATVTLASAFYALKKTSDEYVSLLKQNQLFFGGQLSTVRAIEESQKRIISGMSKFSIEDQLGGIRSLAAVGLNARKELAFVEKAAHATGQSVAQFSETVAQAIRGNTSGLVQMGLLTERAARMFEKYPANTIMRQQAILAFVKQHKGLQTAIINDFETIQDQTLRLKTTWQGFLRSIVGSPNDPGSFYGQVVASLRLVADAFSRNFDEIRKYGYVIGQTLGWVIKQVGHFVVWVGRQVKNAIESVTRLRDNYVEQTRSLILWLEFWKLRLVDFFKEYGSEIKQVIKYIIAFSLLKKAFIITSAAVASVYAYGKALRVGIGLVLTRILGEILVWTGRIQRLFASGVILNGARSLIGILRNIPGLVVASSRAFLGLASAINLTNPVGWIILAITLFGVLYAKCATFRDIVKATFSGLLNTIQFIWNLVVAIFTELTVWFIEIGLMFKKYIYDPWHKWVYSPIIKGISLIKDAVGDLWNTVLDSKVGNFVVNYLLRPFLAIYDSIARIINLLKNPIKTFFNGTLPSASDALANYSKELSSAYGFNAPAIGGNLGADAVAGIERLEQGAKNFSDSLSMGVKNASDGLKNLTASSKAALSSPQVDYLKDFFAWPQRGENEPGHGVLIDDDVNRFAGNPLLEGYEPQEVIQQTSSERQQPTTVQVAPGAVVINLNGSSDIDEDVLARKVRDALQEITRFQNMRGGV